MDPEPKAEVVSRASALLRALAAGKQEGSTTTDAARQTGLARPTAHRLLTSLAHEGLVDRDTRTGLWSLGPELYLLGSLAATRYDVTPRARPVLREIARETGESAFLSARRGDETVCLASEEGSFPLRSHVLHVGLRMPLGVASAGIVILAHLSDREIAEYLTRANLAPEWGQQHSAHLIRERLEATRLDGYSVNPGLLVEGSWGMGAAVFDQQGTPAWALSITGVESRFREERREALGKLLLDQAHRLSQTISARR